MLAVHTQSETYLYDFDQTDLILAQRGTYSEDGKTFTFSKRIYRIDDLKNLPIPDYDVDTVAYMIIADFFGLFTEVVLKADKDLCEDFIDYERSFPSMVHDAYVWEQAVDDALQEALPENEAKIMGRWSLTIQLFRREENFSLFIPFYEKVYDKLARRVDELTQNMLVILAKARLLQLNDEE